MKLVINLILLVLITDKIQTVISNNHKDEIDFLPNWMGYMMPVIRNLTVLDISLPGTHDSISYDLSDTVSINANDLPSLLSRFLHNFHKSFNFVGEFIKKQAVTQTLNVTAQLDAGIRFIDFRAVYTLSPESSFLGKKDWYSLHMVESNKKVQNYWSSIRLWLDKHPTEILVLFLSFHGSTCEPFPSVSNNAKHILWKIFQKTFSGILLDTRISKTNETSINDLISRNHRLIAYMSDYTNTTENSPFAIDACVYLGNELGYSLLRPESIKDMIDRFSNFKNLKKEFKKLNKFYLQSLSGDTTDLLSSAFLTLIPNPITDSYFVEKCGKYYNIPGMINWCPLTLIQSSQLSNYYIQQILESVISNLLTFPNAIYLDAVSTDGIINFGIDSEILGYAYSDTIIFQNLLLVCGKNPGDASNECKELNKIISYRRSLYPLKKINDPKHGRLIDWPIIK